MHSSLDHCRWPTTYVSQRTEERPPPLHDVDNCGYVLQGFSRPENLLDALLPLRSPETSPQHGA